MGTLIFFPMTSKVLVKILYPSRFIILHLRFNTSMIKYGYVINWYQRKGSNIKQVWDKEQSNFDINYIEINVRCMSMFIMLHEFLN